MKSFTKNAFSLIELSIVILIIGILIAGITQSSRLVGKMRLASARSITQNSPVAGIRDLLLWYETSMDNSFDSIETENGTVITNWYDINPQSTYKYNTNQATVTNKPTYTTDVFNGGIPGIRFDGNDNFMLFDTNANNALVRNDYTIFVVEQRRSNKASNFFMAGLGNGGSDNLVLGYQLNATFLQSHYGDDLTISISPFSSPIPTIHTFRFSQTTGQGKSYWLNGGNVEGADIAQTSPILSLSGYTLGRFAAGVSYYLGDLAEVIIFTRALKTEERQSIETYLSKKYGIKIS